MTNSRTDQAHRAGSRQQAFVRQVSPPPTCLTRTARRFRTGAASSSARGRRSPACGASAPARRGPGTAHAASWRGSRHRLAVSPGESGRWRSRRGSRLDPLHAPAHRALDARIRRRPSATRIAADAEPSSTLSDERCPDRSASASCCGLRAAGPPCVVHSRSYFVYTRNIP